MTHPGTWSLSLSLWCFILAAATRSGALMHVGFLLAFIAVLLYAVAPPPPACRCGRCEGDDVG